MKKVVFVTNRLIGGGSERVLVTLANCFFRNGYETYIISYRDGETYPIDDGVNVVTLHNESNKIKRIFMLRHEIVKIMPEAIISFEYFVNMQTIIAALGLNIKVIISERNDPFVRGGDFPNRYIRNFLYMFSDVLVCQTPDAKAYFPEYIQKKSVIIANPIKSDLPEPWHGERKHTVVNFCRLNKQKNLPLLIDAFIEFHKLYQDYRLEIYGDGEEKAYLESYIALKGMSDYIMLYDAVSDIHERVKDASMFVSSSDYEGLSNSMLEAMAIGLPAICTDCPVGGARMVIENGVNGFLVPVGNAEKMTEKMRAIVESEDLASKLSYNSYQIRFELDEETIANRWIQLL